MVHFTSAAENMPPLTPKPTSRTYVTTRLSKSTPQWESINRPFQRHLLGFLSIRVPALKQCDRVFHHYRVEDGPRRTMKEMLHYAETLFSTLISHRQELFSISSGSDPTQQQPELSLSLSLVDTTENLAEVPLLRCASLQKSSRRSW